MKSFNEILFSMRQDAWNVFTFGKQYHWWPAKDNHCRKKELKEILMIIKIPARRKTNMSGKLSSQRFDKKYPGRRKKIGRKILKEREIYMLALALFHKQHILSMIFVI